MRIEYFILLATCALLVSAGTNKHHKKHRHVKERIFGNIANLINESVNKGGVEQAGNASGNGAVAGNAFAVQAPFSADIGGNIAEPSEGPEEVSDIPIDGEPSLTPRPDNDDLPPLIQELLADEPEPVKEPVPEPQEAVAEPVALQAVLSTDIVTALPCAVDGQCRTICYIMQRNGKCLNDVCVCIAPENDVTTVEPEVIPPKPTVCSNEVQENACTVHCVASKLIRGYCNKRQQCICTNDAEPDDQNCEDYDDEEAILSNSRTTTTPNPIEKPSPSEEISSEEQPVSKEPSDVNGANGGTGTGGDGGSIGSIINSNFAGSGTGTGGNANGPGSIGGNINANGGSVYAEVGKGADGKGGDGATLTVSGNGVGNANDSNGEDAKGESGGYIDLISGSNFGKDVIGTGKDANDPNSFGGNAAISGGNLHLELLNGEEKGEGANGKDVSVRKHHNKKHHGKHHGHHNKHHVKHEHNSKHHHNKHHKHDSRNHGHMTKHHNNKHHHNKHHGHETKHHEHHQNKHHGHMTKHHHNKHHEHETKHHHSKHHGHKNKHHGHHDKHHGHHNKHHDHKHH